MNDTEKKSQLRKYKMFATGLFVLMALLFIFMTILSKKNPAHWIGYIRAFAEAAMVGALADWFAVTALFHHPLGLRIPHTNLIQNSKDRIGDNLGSFVVENFLASDNIRPYIQKLKVSGLAGEWLSIQRNQDRLLTEISAIILDIVSKLDDDLVTRFITAKATEMLGEVKLNQFAGNGLEYLLQRDDHQKIITGLAAQIKNYIVENQETVRSRVKRESYFLIPKFVDEGIAAKITKGLAIYFEEVEHDASHQLRAEITNKLLHLADEMRSTAKWEEEFQKIKTDFLTPEKTAAYAADIWRSLKKTLVNELQAERSVLKKYVQDNLRQLAENLQTDPALQQKIDGWLRMTAYKYILKNTHRFGELISSTVGNWEGKELSQKLEVEVGKDLQFIRVNGTLVGGLVGLIIYTVANFFL